MDLPKIKSILIVILIFTNVLLGWAIYQRNITFEHVAQDNLQDVLKLYANKGIALETNHLKFPSKIGSVNLEYETFGIDAIDSLMGLDYVFDGTKYSSGEAITYVNETKIFYSKIANKAFVFKDDYLKHDQSKEIVDGDTLKISLDKVDSFLIEHKFDNSYQAYSVWQSGAYTLVLLQQVYEGIIFDESQTVIWIFNDEIVGFKRQSIAKISTTEGSNYDIISIDHILYALLPDVKENDQISDISIVYKLNDASLFVSNLVSGEALPYFRIELSSGDVFHLQAVVSP